MGPVRVSGRGVGCSGGRGARARTHRVAARGERATRQARRNSGVLQKSPKKRLTPPSSLDPSQLGTLSPAVVNQRAAGVSPAGTVGDIDLSKLSYRGRSGHGGGALAPCMYVRICLVY